MSLKTSLLITGDASGAVAAAADADRAMAANTATADRSARAYREADQAIGRLAAAQAEATIEVNATKAAYAAGEITLEQYNRELLETRSALTLIAADHRTALTELRKANAAQVTSMNAVTEATAGQKAGLMQIGLQAGDMITMWNMGAPIAQIFASQIGQITGAAQLALGQTSALGAFLSGPWGIAVSVATIALVPFIANLFESGDAAQDAAADYKAAADEARGLAGALNALALTKRQISLNEKRDRASQLELAIGKRPRGPNGEAMFSYKDQKDLQALRWEIMAEENIVRLAEAQNEQQARKAEEAARKARGGSSRRGSGGAGRGERASRAGVDEADNLARRIAGIRDQFSELPAAVKKSNDALRDLDAIAAKIEGRKGPKYDGMRADLAATRTAVEQSLTQPFEEFLEKARQSAEIDQLLIAGKFDQAAALREVINQQERMRPLSEAQLEAVLQTVQAERQRAIVLRDQRALIEGNVTAVHDMRASLEQTFADMMRGRFSLKRIVGSLGNSFMNTMSQRLVESMFGDVLRALEGQATSGPIHRASQAMAVSMDRGSDAVEGFAAVVRRVTAEMRGSSSAGDTGDASYVDGGEITVSRERPTIPGEGDYRNFIVDMGAQIARQFGLKVPPAVVDVIQKGMSRIEKSLPDVMKGGLIGASASQMLLGDKGSSLGGAIGGALGGKIGEKFLSAGLSKISSSLGGLAGPIGSIAGGLIGGLLGGMLKKTKKGMATIGGVDGELGVTGTTGNSSSRKAAATGMAGEVIDIVDRVAQALGGSIDPSKGSVSIGVRDKDYRVDTSGQGLTKKKKGAIDFGDDQAAALAYAAADLVADGVVTGLSAAVTKALKSSSDIEKALQEALKVQEVELLIGGLGAELEKAFKDFERQAAERLRIAREYGFDVVELEKRNAEDRLKLSEQLLADQIGGLQSLIDEMTSGSLYEGSAVDQRKKILEQIATTKADADAGKEGAADKLAGLLEQLNAVSKEVYGTAGGFADDRTAILDQARDAIAKANQRITDAQKAAEKASDPALATTNAALDESNDQLAKLAAEAGVTNEHLAGILAALGQPTDSKSLELLWRASK